MRAPIRVSSRRGSPILIFWVRFTTSFVKVSRIFLSTNTLVPLQHTWDTGQAAQNRKHSNPQSFPAWVLLQRLLEKPLHSCCNSQLVPGDKEPKEITLGL